MNHRETFFLTGLLLLCICARGAAESDDGFVIDVRPEKVRAEISQLRPRVLSSELGQAQIAAAELAATHNAAALPLLWELFNTGNLSRRLLAVRSLAALALPQEADHLALVAAGDICQSVRLGAAEALKELISPPEACARLAKIAGDEQRASLVARVRALQGLAGIGGPAAVQVLQSFAASRQNDLAVAAVEGLGKLRGKAAAPLLVKALSGANAELKPALADALEEISGKTYRFNLVKWTAWLKEAEDGSASSTESGEKKTSAASGEPASQARGDPVDLAILFDTTASMTRIWPQLSAALNGILGESIKQNGSLRLASIKYRALVDSSKYVLSPLPLTREHQRIRDDVLDASFGGPSGALYAALRHAADGLCWRAGAKKVILMVGDESPSGNGLPLGEKQVADLAADGVLVHAIYVCTAHGEAEQTGYWELVRAGRGRLYEYNKAEKHLVELTAAKVDVRQAETPAQTAAKLLTPRETK